MEKNIVIYGDINGNGSIDSVDLVRLRKYLIGLIDITGTNAIAADVSRDKNISSVDLVRIRKHLIELIVIEQ